MKACKSQYDYAQLVSNYIKFNLHIKRSTDLPDVADKFTSTAKGRLSFDGPYLISYSTQVAKFIHTKKAIYIFIDKDKYSITTTKQLGVLRGFLPTNIIMVEAANIDDSFNSIKDYYLNCIYDTYAYCKKARNGLSLQTAIEAYKAAILSIIPELSPSIRKATLLRLNTLPTIPNKLNKFTRPVTLSVLKDKGLL